LDSVEFDVSAAKQKLQVGHPVDLIKNAKAGLTPPALADMLSTLQQVWAQQIVVDVKALQWNAKASRAEFAPTELETLLSQLPAALAEYRKDMGELIVHGQAVQPEIVVASVNGEFFEEARARGVQFGDGVQTRWFARDTDTNPFAEGRRLGVTQIGLQFPGSDPSQKKMMQTLNESGRAEYIRTRLAALRDMHQAEFQDLNVSFYIVNDADAEQQIREFFPGAEIISDQAATLEKKELRTAERGR
jgi:hypothetical protein